MRLAPITRVRATPNGAIVFGKLANGHEVQVTVDEATGSKAMSFDIFSAIAVGSDGSLSLIAKSGASGGNRMHFTKSVGDTPPQSATPPVVISAQAVVRAVYQALKEQVKDMNPETAADVLAQAAATALAALRQSGFQIDDEDVTGPADANDPSLHPRSAIDLSGRQPRPVTAAAMPADLRKLLDAERLSPVERALAHAGDIKGVIALQRSESSGDIAKVLVGRLDAPGRLSKSGTSDSLLKEPEPFHGTVRKGLSIDSDGLGGRRVVPTGDDLVGNLMGAVRKNQSSRALDFSAVSGGGGTRMAVNRMLADFQDFGREDLVKAIHARSTVGVELEKLLR